MNGNLVFKGLIEVATDVQVMGMVGQDVQLDLLRQAVSLHHNTQIEGVAEFYKEITFTFSSE